MTLYHYTCRHVRPMIGTRGMLRPRPQPVLGGMPLLWLTDQEVPDHRGLGLTSQILDCDRLEFRYIVEVTDARRWIEFAAMSTLGPLGRMMLESCPGARPDTWWTVDHAVLGVLDRAYPRAAGLKREHRRVS